MGGSGDSPPDDSVVRTARSRTSKENLPLRAITPALESMEPPANPGRFKGLYSESIQGGLKQIVLMNQVTQDFGQEPVAASVHMAFSLIE